MRKQTRSYARQNRRVSVRYEMGPNIVTAAPSLSRHYREFLATESVHETRCMGEDCGRPIRGRGIQDHALCQDCFDQMVNHD